MLQDYIGEKPVLETERLILRTLKPSDAPDLKEWCGEVSLYRYWGICRKAEYKVIGYGRRHVWQETRMTGGTYDRRHVWQEARMTGGTYDANDY